MRKIELTRGKFAVVDATDFEWLSQWNWYATVNSVGNWYAGRSDWSGRGSSPKQIRMHRLILGATESEKVDHRDGNGLNNQRQNLRKADRIQNGQNRKKNRDTTSIYKGVFRAKRSPNEKWGAQIQVNKRKKWIGYFPTEVEAAKAYDKSACENFGVFACVNFPGLDNRSAI